MKHNVFQFRDTYWVQQTGTAMGAPPAPMYATLYFYIHEENIINQYNKNICFYGRYIDDGFGIWCYNMEKNWDSFIANFNKFGKLEWDFSRLTKN